MRYIPRTKLENRIAIALAELRDLIDGDSPLDSDISRIIDMLEGCQWTATLHGWDI